MGSVVCVRLDLFTVFVQSTLHTLNAGWIFDGVGVCFECRSMMNVFVDIIRPCNKRWRCSPHICCFSVLRGKIRSDAGTTVDAISY